MKYDVDTIEQYDAERTDFKFDAETESDIRSCFRAIADKPHRAHLYLRDLIRSDRNRIAGTQLGLMDKRDESMENQTSLDELRRLIVGGTVENVTQNAEMEGMITLHVRVNEVFLEVPLFATELGWWIRGVRSVEDGVPSYLDAHTMFREMAEFSYIITDLERIQCVPLDNSERPGDVGFRVMISQENSPQSRDFWISLARCAGSPWILPLSTPDGRRWIAEHPSGPFLWEREDPRITGRWIEPWVDPAPGGTT